jgi:hypothetical protein
MVDNGISDPFAVDLAEAGAPVVVNGTAYHLLDVGGVRLYAAAEVTPQGLGLQFLDALPAPVPERPAWALLALGGLLGAVARSAAAVGGPRPQPDRCAPRSHGAPCGRRIRSAS